MHLLPRHQLVIMDDQNKFDGATSHEIRNHFNSWVADEFTRVLVKPEEFLKDPEKLADALLFFLAPDTISVFLLTIFVLSHWTT